MAVQNIAPWKGMKSMTLVPNWDYCRIFEIRCLCSGAWVLRSEHDDWSFGRLLGVEKKSVLTYVCNRMKECYGMGMKARLQSRYHSLLKDSLPSRPALRYCDIARDYHQAFKKSVKGRRGLNKRADNVFYSHVLYRDNLHENRVEALENALNELRRGHPQDPYIQSMQHEFFWKPTDDGLLTHALRVEFPSRSFSITLNV